MKLKLLNKNGAPSNGGADIRYSLPTKNDSGEYTPGEWMPAINNISLCARGYHVTKIDHLLAWRGDLLCIAEIRGKTARDESKTVAEQIRLIEIVEGWNEKNLRLFAADCAERVLPIFEEKYPSDDRPRKAIAAARQFANGELTRNQLKSASYAANAASYAANAASYAAANAASYAANAAAASYAANAAYAYANAAYAYARKTEWRAQIKLLRKYLGL